MPLENPVMGIQLMKEKWRMDKFIPKEKLSKKAKREKAAAQRQTWGGLSPVTRKAQNPKAYVREKPRIDGNDDTGALFKLEKSNEENNFRNGLTSSYFYDMIASLNYGNRVYI
jgi:hypothetical protein